MIKVERKMAEIQGIPLKILGAAEEYKQSSQTQNSLQKHVIARDKLNQWRILIYPLSISVFFVIRAY